MEGQNLLIGKQSVRWLQVNFELKLLCASDKLGCVVLYDHI